VRQVFRTNSSYARWEEARRTWGGVVNRSRDLLRQVSCTMHDLNNMAFGGLLHIVHVYAQLAAKQEPAGFLPNRGRRGACGTHMVRRSVS